MSDASVAVIPTEYDGTMYRSRTEARWAVFLTSLRCPFEYEPEGFRLPQAGGYIPDFYLTNVDKFIEIKPSVCVEGRESPVEEFAEVTDKSIYVFRGSPSCDNYSGYPEWVSAEVYFGRTGRDEGHQFCICPRCGTVDIQHDGRCDRIPCACQKSFHGDKGYNAEDDRLIGAYRRSSSAFRFKRGGGQ